MAVDPINGNNIKGSDYLQKSSQKSSDVKISSKDQITPQATTINTKNGSVNPVSNSMYAGDKNNMTNKNPVNSNVDSLDLSAQAKNAYNNKTPTNNKTDKEAENTNDISIKTTKSNYSSQEDKVNEK